MKLYDLREYLYDVVKRYFQAANVVWAGETQPKQPYPLVMMSLRNLTVSTQPNTESTEDEIIRLIDAIVECKWIHHDRAAGGEPKINRCHSGM